MADDVNKKNTEPEDEGEVSPYPFDNLPQDIRDWLLSDEVNAIIERLNGRYEPLGINQRGIGSCLTRIPIGYLKPDQFIPELVANFNTPANIAREIAQEVLLKILTPIKPAMRNKLGINVELIAQAPQATAAMRTMEMQRAAAVKPQPKIIKVAPAPPAPPAIPKSRVTSFQTVVTDLRRPTAPQQTAIKPKPTEPSNTNTAAARTMDMENIARTQATSAAPKPKATTPTTTKKGVEPEILEAEKPFGLAESIPKPPEPHEIIKYQDEHPMLEKQGS